MFERFSGFATPRSCKVIVLANREAKKLKHQYLGTEHILLGLVGEGSGVGCHVLKSFNLELDKVRDEILKLVKVGPEHLLLGLLREQDGVAAQVLMNRNLRLEDVRAEVLKILAPLNPRERVIAAAKELGDSIVAFLDHPGSPPDMK